MIDKVPYYISLGENMKKEMKQVIEVENCNKKLYKIFYG